MSLLNHVANDFVIEELDLDPLDALLMVFVLLVLQCQVDEQLLQLLVAQIDTELFETERKIITIVEILDDKFC